MEYVQIPKTVTYKELIERSSLSPSSYKTLSLKNKNVNKINELISEKPRKGLEVGSSSYIRKSKFFFIRTKALQTSYFLPILDNTECAVPILPIVFKDFELQKGDILISKDANIGESAFLNEDLPNSMISGGIVRLRFSEDIKHYVFAFMKSDFFKSQIELMIPRGATMKHAKTLWLDAVIPFPNQQNKDEIIKFVSLLVRAIIRKEAEIKNKYRTIIALIDKELNDNQKTGRFIFYMPTIKELQATGRLDASIYSKELKHKIFSIENYKHEFSTLQQIGFKPRRGPNLAVSVIGQSIYSEENKSNFFRLIEPMDITDFMIVRRYRYLGNKKQIPFLRKGDILFGAEGSIGKVFIFCDALKNTITNYHGMAINKDKSDLIENIFLGCFLSYLREEGILDRISVGGQGGSVGKKKLLNLKIPKFPRDKKEEITKYYYCPMNYTDSRLNLSDFENEDLRIIAESGIWQLDKQIKQIRRTIDEVLYRIIMDEEIQISFGFLKYNEEGLDI